VTTGRRSLAFCSVAAAVLATLATACDLFFPEVEVHVLNATDSPIAYVEAREAAGEVVYQSDSPIGAGSEAVVMLAKGAYTFLVQIDGAQPFVSDKTDLTHVERYTLRVVLLDG
jgi:hypothetical protein